MGLLNLGKIGTSLFNDWNLRSDQLSKIMNLGVTIMIFNLVNLENQQNELGMGLDEFLVINDELRLVIWHEGGWGVGGYQKNG